MAEFPPVSTQVDQARYSFLSQRVTGSSVKLEVRCVGRERCQPDYQISREAFSGYGIEFVLAGLGKVVLDGNSWLLRPGALFCYGPQTPHLITTQREDPMTKYFVNFRGREVPALLRGSALRSGGAVYTLEVEAFRSLFEAMISEGGKGLASSAEICTRYLQVLVLKTHEAISPRHAQLSRAGLNFQRCQAFIDSHFLEVHTLDDIARRIHVTPAYLCRLFSQFGQPSPFQYLSRKKLNRAAELLAGEGYSVKQAAAATGYADPYHFSRIFSRFFGLSPAAFAKNHRR